MIFLPEVKESVGHPETKSRQWIAQDSFSVGNTERLKRVLSCVKNEEFILTNSSSFLEIAFRNLNVRDENAAPRAKWDTAKSFILQAACDSAHLQFGARVGEFQVVTDLGKQPGLEVLSLY